MVGPRRADAAASVGAYLALATLSRVVAPRSKPAFAAWWQTTAGGPAAQAASGDAGPPPLLVCHERVNLTELGAIERAVPAQMVERFDLDLAGLVLDITNFATFVDSANPRNRIAQRGHAKQKRFGVPPPETDTGAMRRWSMVAG